MNAQPDCDCFMLTGAHDEKCAWVRWLRAGGAKDDDLEIPTFLDRRKKPAPADGGAFD